MKSRLRRVLIPTVSVVVFVLLWHAAVVYFEVPTYLVPKPALVADAFWNGYVGGRFWPHLATTLWEMAAGYGIGCGIALVLGALVAEWETLEEILNPFVIALQSMPKVALAPLLLVWFGFGVTSKIILVALICFFPVFINAAAGFKSANPDLLRLYRAFSARRGRVFLSVKLPSAADSIFAGLQIAIVLALIGAVVGEFVSSRSGLGFLIQSSTLSFDVATMFAAIVSLSLIGIVLTGVLKMIQRRVVHWNDSVERRTEPTSA